MFLASTRCGLIACRHLARCYYTNTYTSAPEIAEKYNMNVRALMPALRQLTRYGILRSRVGGKEPGFMFSRSPREITLLEVITALEGNHSVPCCKELIAGLKCDCKAPNECGVYNLFNGVIKQMNLKMAQISIEDHARSIQEPEVADGLELSCCNVLNNL